MYFTFAKLGWSLALSFLMYSMAMGWGGFVRRFLGASFWNPLARLTYSTYLFHPIIMFVVYYSHLQYPSFCPILVPHTRTTFQKVRISSKDFHKWLNS
jgi:peptidoglycan/LPS O-acetylase OafA/YrhL